METIIELLGPILGPIVAYFAAPALLLQFVTLIVGYINKAINVEGKAAWVISAIVSGVIVFVGCHYNVGFLAEATTVQCAAWALGLTLAANGWFSLDEIKKLLDKLGAGQPSVKTFVASKKG